MIIEPPITPLCEVLSLFSISYLHVQVWISNYEFAAKFRDGRTPP